MLMGSCILVAAPGADSHGKHLEFIRKAIDKDMQRMMKDLNQLHEKLSKIK